MKPTGILVVVGISFAAAMLAVKTVDGRRAAVSLGKAYTAREAGARCFSQIATGWEFGQWAGVGLFRDGPDFKAWSKLAEAADQASPSPILFGKERVLALNILSKQYADLTRNPAGTWITYNQQIAEIRSRFDAAILAVESEDASHSSAENARSATRIEVARTEKVLSDAVEKKAADERKEQEAARQATIDRVRTGQDVGEQLARMRAESGRTAGEPQPTPVPLAIDFSRPKPTPALGRR